MGPRFSWFAVFLFLFLPWTPCLASDADDLAGAPVASDNLADAGTRADNTVDPAAGTDNVAASLWPDNQNTLHADNGSLTSQASDNETPAVEGEASASIAIDGEAPANPANDNEALTSPATDNATLLSENDDDEFREPNFGDDPAPHTVADPIEPLNRAFFVFNDKFYYWVAKPVARGYSYAVNEDIRISVRNFFSNIGTPVRAVNNLLQGNIVATGTELLRLLMNSTMGILGFFDVARDFGIEKANADLGQTLGKYGIGDGMYLVLPIFGPSTLRDGVGSIGNAFLDPVYYLQPWELATSVSVYRAGNNASLQIGLYEELTEPALDPYIAVKDAYIQNRVKVIRGRPASD